MGDLCVNFYKLFRNPIFMKFVGGYPSTIRMIRKIGNPSEKCQAINFILFSIHVVLGQPPTNFMNIGFIDNL